MSLVALDISFDISDTGLQLLPKVAVADDDDVQLLGQIWLNDYVTLGERIAAAGAVTTKKTVPFPHALRNKFIQMWMNDDHEFELVLSDDPLPGSIVPSFLCAYEQEVEDEDDEDAAHDSRFIKLFPCLPIQAGATRDWVPNFNQYARKQAALVRNVDADQVVVKSKANNPSPATIEFMRGQKMDVLRNQTVSYTYDTNIQYEQGETVLAVISLVRASDALGWDVDVTCTPGLELCLDAKGRDVFVRSVQM